MEFTLGGREVFQQCQALQRVEQALVQHPFQVADMVEDFQSLGRCPQNGPPRMLGVESATLGQHDAIGQRQDVFFAGAFQDQFVGVGPESIERAAVFPLRLIRVEYRIDDRPVGFAER
ncbi:hypothetical protein D9M71_766180 [compost metagenome]